MEPSRTLFQQGASEKRFLWDGENVLLERDGARGTWTFDATNQLIPRSEHEELIRRLISATHAATKKPVGISAPSGPTAK